MKHTHVRKTLKNARMLNSLKTDAHMPDLTHATTCDSNDAHMPDLTHATHATQTTHTCPTHISNAFCLSVSTYMRARAFWHVHVCACLLVYLSVGHSVYLSACLFVCMCLCVRVYVHVCFAVCASAQGHQYGVTKGRASVWHTSVSNRYRSHYCRSPSDGC